MFIWKLIRRYSRLVDKLVYTKLEDLLSWRNTLVVITGIFCFKALKVDNEAIVATVFASWTAIVAFYFHVRSKSEIVGANKTTNFGKEENKDDDSKEA